MQGVAGHLGSHPMAGGALGVEGLWYDVELMRDRARLRANARQCKEGNTTTRRLGGLFVDPH